jgi:hypothetical protein
VLRTAIRRARPVSVAVTLLGAAATVAMLLVSVRIATAATFHPHLLVPSGRRGLPAWMAGPFAGLGSRLGVHDLGRLVILLGVLYIVVLVCARWIPRGLAIAAAVLLIATFALAPPLLSTDIFNYVAYARMGALYHVNPYLHGAAAIARDPSVPFTGPVWLHTSTTYGPLFTLLSYAFVPLGVGGAMWAFKATAGLAAAVGVKVTAGLVLPFVLVASSARWRVLAGAALGALAISVLALAAFGPHVLSMFNLLQHHDQFTKPISSVPGYLGYVLGEGGLTPARHHALQLVFYAGALGLLAFAWRRRDWLVGGAGALLLMIATLGWMLPWYVVWVLPLAPLARRRWVPLGAIALTAVVVAIQIHSYDTHIDRATRLHAHVLKQPGLPGPRLLERGG